MVKRKQAPRTTRAHKKAALDAAVDSLPSPRPGSPMYKSWRAIADALGIKERSQPQTHAELLENPDPHGRVSAALKTAQDSIQRGGGQHGTTIRNARLLAKLKSGGGVDLSLNRKFTKARKRGLKNAMQLTGVTPLPTVDTFVKWLRRRDAE